MAYRLITKATLVIGKRDAIAIELRAYPEPKRAAAGKLTLDGKEQEFRVTGGKGRGSVSNTYIYTKVKGESAFALIPASHAPFLTEPLQIGVPDAARTVEPPKVEQPAPAPAPAAEPTAKKAPRRVKKEAVAA